jgi:succinate dehydrogenase/fumarate reductase-like Fe-S protein
MKAFGLNSNGLSESAQMGVGDMEDDFEELDELYGEKMKIHPLVRIPIRTCMMIYMVHLTNQMAQKSPVPNMDQILRSNPDIARQLATAAIAAADTVSCCPSAACTSHGSSSFWKPSFGSCQLHE